MTDFWDRTLGVVQVKTPDRSLDILVNGWLLYQTLSSRVWGAPPFISRAARTGIAINCRTSWLCAYCAPAHRARTHLEGGGAAIQEGDMQHWWLPTSGQGIKTRVSDDRIWLPFVVAHYLEVTGDLCAARRTGTFLGRRSAAPGTERSSGRRPRADPAPLSSIAFVRSIQPGNWCARPAAVRHRRLERRHESRGLAGHGESVWLAWFLYAALCALRRLPSARRESAPPRWRKHAFAVQQAIEREAWDGDWYRRGYYDDGTVWARYPAMNAASIPWRNPGR